MNNKPVMTAGGVSAAVAALIALLVSFGLPISEDQTNAILGLVAVAAPLVTAYLTRHKVDVPKQ